PPDLLRRDGTPGGHAPTGRLAELGLQPADHRDEPRARAELPHQEGAGPGISDGQQGGGVDGTQVVVYCGPSGRLTRKPLSSPAGSSPTCRLKGNCVTSIPTPSAPPIAVAQQRRPR